MLGSMFEGPGIPHRTVAGVPAANLQQRLLRSLFFARTLWTTIREMGTRCTKQRVTASSTSSSVQGELAIVRSCRRNCNVGHIWARRWRAAKAWKTVIAEAWRKRGACTFNSLSLTSPDGLLLRPSYLQHLFTKGGRVLPSFQIVFGRW